MLVPYTETVCHVPILDEHVFQNIEISCHKLRLAIACTSMLARISKPT
jgi:hypothetical protein